MKLRRMRQGFADGYAGRVKRYPFDRAYQSGYRLGAAHAERSEGRG